MKKLLILFFAATAPEAPDWFQPKNLQEVPPHPGAMRNVFGNSGNRSQEEKKLFNDHWDDDNDCWNTEADIPSELIEATKHHLAVIRIWISLREEIEQKRTIQKTVQWRYFYAIAMAEGRRYE